MNERSPDPEHIKAIAIGHLEAAATEAWLDGYDTRTAQIQMYLQEMEFSEETKAKLIAFGFLKGPE